MIPSTFLRNGVPATKDDLSRVAFSGFAHFTAMQVRGGAVRGLDLHLTRLRAASDTMFTTHLNDEVVLDHLGRAVAAGPPDVSMAFYIASQPGEFEGSEGAPQLETFVSVSAPATPPAGPLSLDVVAHQRDLPQVKHVGEVAKTLYLRRANARGFDDALFVDAGRRVSEATIWNLAFWDGSRVIWPQAEMLDGVTQQIVRRQLSHRGIAQETRPIPVDRINPHWSAALMNSWSPGIGVSRIGESRLGEPARLLEVLHAAFASAEEVSLAGVVAG